MIDTNSDEFRELQVDLFRAYAVSVWVAQESNDKLLVRSRHITPAMKTRKGV